jgi:hypothetical protein
LPFRNDVQPDHSHQFQGVALFDHAGPQTVIERHLAVFEMILEMQVDGASIE